MIRVDELLRLLYEKYGPQNWWPARDRFEIMVGALLVQRTSWWNVELALARLRDARLLDAGKLARARPEALEPLLEPVGFHRVKSRRLVGLARFVVEHGGTDGLAALTETKLEHALLGVEGFGRESESVTRLYAFSQPVWVSDAYSRRILSRLDPRLAGHAAERAFISPLVERRDTQSLNELHALFVEHGKQHCRTVPRCDGCVLARQCRHVGQ